MRGTEKVFATYRTGHFEDSDLAATDEAYFRYLAWLPTDRDARLLDLGCGGGEFLSFLARHGYRAVAGIDLSAQQVERCRERGLERVAHVGDGAAYLRGKVGAFDCIVLNDVLEHIPKAQCVEMLEAIRGALAEGGSVVIKVPNMANAFGLVARYLDFTHEIGFTEGSLRQVLVAAGFERIDVTGLPVALKASPKRIAFWLANRGYLALHRLAYFAAVGTDAPTLLTKLILARAMK